MVATVPITKHKKFKSIKNRVRDMMESSGEDIEAGRFARISLSIFQEMDWLIKAIERNERGEEVEEEVLEEAGV